MQRWKKGGRSVLLDHGSGGCLSLNFPVHRQTCLLSNLFSLLQGSSPLPIHLALQQVREDFRSVFPFFPSSRRTRAAPL